MGYKEPAYVIFDGDSDKWAYAYMLGWKANDKIDFDFRDAHDLDSMTGRAQDEAYVKTNLRERMNKSKSVIVLVGEKTKNLYKYVRWELELALELGLPIVVVNLDNSWGSGDRWPALMKTACVVSVPFKMAAIKHALDNWPTSFRGLDSTQKAQGPRSYPAEQFKEWLK